VFEELNKKREIRFTNISNINAPTQKISAVMDKNSILEFNNKESASSINHFFSGLKPSHKVEMSVMCVCFNYQNSIKLFTSIFTSTGLAYVIRFLHFMLYVQLPFPLSSR